VENEPRLIEEYIRPGKVRLVYRHLVQLGDGSLRTAEASDCAGDQGKFWEMRALLYQRQSEVYAGEIDGVLAGFAQDVGLDGATFGQCMQDGTHRAAVEADHADATSAGVRSRPVFDIGATRLVGFQPWRTFQGAVDGQLP
jgi:protein-disulfide isomerase